MGAFGGRSEIMDCLSPLGPVYQAGTLSGNPVAMAAGLAQLLSLIHILIRRGAYDQRRHIRFFVDKLLIQVIQKLHLALRFAKKLSATKEWMPYIFSGIVLMIGVSVVVAWSLSLFKHNISQKFFHCLSLFRKMLFYNNLCFSSCLLYTSGSRKKGIQGNYSFGCARRQS